MSKPCKCCCKRLDRIRRCVRKPWDEAGKFSPFQWVVLFIITLTLICSAFSAIVEYVLWTKLGGQP